MLKFVHVRPHSIRLDQRYAHKGGITLAYTMPERKGDRMIWVSAAFCNKMDTYNKKKGRELATEKWLRGERIQIATSHKQGLGLQLSRVFRDLMYLSIPYDNEDNHGRVRKGRPQSQVSSKCCVQGNEPAGDQQEASTGSGC